jgi:3-deoxy-D-manno-octulosonic acid kinase
LQEINNKKSTIWVADNASSYFRAEWFNPSIDTTAVRADKWQLGRQSVTHFNANGYYMVLRHYCRGGIPAKFSRDKFIFHGWHATRAYRELVLLESMACMSLPVPVPVAAKCELKGAFYTSDIIMHEIKNSETLAQILIKDKLPPQVWQRVGRIIKKFHLNGIQHVDLNANNILIDGDEHVYLIDFDRCMQRKYSDVWGRRGLERLKRSLLKIKSTNSELAFCEDDFRVLSDAYKE